MNLKLCKRLRRHARRMNPSPARRLVVVERRVTNPRNKRWVKNDNIAVWGVNDPTSQRGLYRRLKAHARTEGRY